MSVLVHPGEGAMAQYAIRCHHVEKEQARIGIQVAKNWVWPYAYSEEALLEIHAQPGFDPETRHYCFLGDQMVGYLITSIAPPERGEAARDAQLDFPRALPGHEGAAGLLLERALKTLARKGVERVTGRVSTMVPEEIRLAETMGFSLSEWGYKVYYSYETGRGKLDLSGDAVEEIDLGKDLDECAELAARWYGRPSDWCRSHLQAWHAAGIVGHFGVREQGRMVAACMVALNEIRPSTAAIYYIYTPDECSLEPMLVNVVNRCVDRSVNNVIADLINEHRQCEPAYQRLGFRKVAEWARCHKAL
jgi:hypothetical protein